jgi:hypothetical protein
MFRSYTRIIIRLHIKTVRKNAKNVYVAHDIMRYHNLLFLDSQVLSRRTAAARLQRLLVLVSVVCCQVEVCAMCRSLVQRGARACVRVCVCY